MSHSELPKRTPNEPPIAGPHEIVGEEGITHHLVFAGPNATPRPETATESPITQADLAPLATSLNTKPREPFWLWHYLTATIVVFSYVISAITAGLLCLEYRQLSDVSRLACATVTLIGLVTYIYRYTHRRKVRS